MSDERLESCMADVDVLANDPGSVMTTFIVTQVAARSRRRNYSKRHSQTNNSKPQPHAPSKTFAGRKKPMGAKESGILVFPSFSLFALVAVMLIVCRSLRAATTMIARRTTRTLSCHSGWAHAMTVRRRADPDRLTTNASNVNPLAQGLHSHAQALPCRQLLHR